MIYILYILGIRKRIKKFRKYIYLNIKLIRRKKSGIIQQK